MTTPAQTNLSGSSGKPEAGFEASGLSPEEAERLSAEFKPSWEFDEPAVANGAHGNGSLAPAHADGRGDLQARGNTEARTVPPHTPPQRVETHEPEVSVIIDRSITAAEIDAHRSAQAANSRPPPAAVPAPYGAPAFAAPAPVPQRVAPVLRPPRSADDSLELPTSLKKSNKGLFIGLGAAFAAAALVLIAHGAMSSSSDTPSSTTAATSTAAADNAQRATSIPPIPPPPATAAQAAPPPPVAAPPAATVPAPTPGHPAAPPPRVQAAHVPPPAPPPPAVHHAAPAPRTPPKAPGGGIVRDNPF